MKPRGRPGLLVPVSILLLAGASPAPVASQLGVVEGVVRGEGQALSYVRVEAILDGAVRSRVMTDQVGRYSLSMPPGEYVLLFTLYGYAQQRLEGVGIQAGTTANRDVELLVRPIPIDAVVLTAARGPQGVLDVPATSSIVDQRSVEERVGMTPIDHVITVPGVDIAVQGLLGRQVVARGFNSTLNSSLLLLTDYRNAALPGVRSNLAYFMPLGDDDIERIEVVRGPASALYGPNAADGVIHFISKSPFDSPGGTLRMAAGGRDIFEGAGRFGAVLSDDFAVKASGSYFRGNEWPSPAHPFETLAPSPTATRWKAEVRADWRPTATGTATITAGTAMAVDHVEYSDIGRFQLADWRTDFAQFRYVDGLFNAQVYYNGNPGGGTSTSLQGGGVTLDHSHVLAGQVQHGFEYGAGGLVSYGFDLQRTNSQTLGTIHGRFEGDDLAHEGGAYVQAFVPAGERVRFVAAARVDHHDRLAGARFSPRLGVTFKPTESQSFRASFNRAFATPDPARLFADILVARLDPLPFAIQAVGVPAEGLRYDRSCAGNLCLASPFTPGVEYGLNDLSPLWGVVVAALADEGVDISGIPAPMPGDIETSLRILDLNAGAYTAFTGPLNDLERLRPTITTSYEVGYKGFWQDQFMVDLVGYRTQRRDFFGPLTLVTPNAFYSTQSLAQYLGNFMPADEAAALAAGIGGIDGDPAVTGLPLATPAATGALAGTDIFMTYQNVGKVSLWGADLSVLFAPNASWVLSASYSWVNDNLFTPSRPGESEISTNGPRQRGLASVRYHWPGMDLSLELRGRAAGAFEMRDGVLSGRVDGYAITDLEAGIALPGIPAARLTLTAFNVADKRHAEFFGHAVLGRLFMSRLEYRF